jgi:hypothetical protein
LKPKIVLKKLEGVLFFGNADGTREVVAAAARNGNAWDLRREKLSEVAIQRAVATEKKDAISARNQREFQVLHGGVLEDRKFSVPLGDVPESRNVAALCARSGHREDAAH